MSWKCYNFYVAINKQICAFFWIPNYVSLSCFTCISRAIGSCMFNLKAITIVSQNVNTYIHVLFWWTFSYDIKIMPHFTAPCCACFFTFINECLHVCFDNYVCVYVWYAIYLFCLHILYFDEYFASPNIVSLLHITVLVIPTMLIYAYFLQGPEQNCVNE